MVEDLYSEFDANIIIRSKQRKTFDENTLDLRAIKSVSGVSLTCKAVEEIVVLRHEKKWVNAKMIGVEDTYLQMAHVQKHMVDGFPHLTENNIPTALVGALLLQKLGGFIPTNAGHETLLCYFPKRDARVSVSSNPFRTENLNVAGRVNYNKEVNESYIVLPLDLATSMLGYEKDITAVYVSVKSNADLEKVKEEIQNKVGDKFEVKTHLEKNELIYKTSKSEKLIVIAILVFVFILAAFNLVASLTMLYIEKKKNIWTLQSFGANESFIFRIFFYEGLLIAFKGVIYGILIGVTVCLMQIYGHLLVLPNTNNQPFPIELTVTDGLFVLTLVSILSIVASYFPVKYLVYKNRLQ